jgi:hypothetical protein
MKHKRQSKFAKAKRKHPRGNSRSYASLLKRHTKGTNRAKGRKPAIRRQGSQLHLRRPTTPRQYYAMSQRDQEIWDSVVHVISRMRDGVSLNRASEEFGITSSTVIELGRPALRKRNGQYVPTKTDRLLRVVTALTVKGKEVIATRDSRQASLVGGHWAAVQRYLQTGDHSALLRFQGTKVIDANKKRHLLLTNLKEIDRLASAGVLSFESIYAGGAH